MGRINVTLPDGTVTSVDEDTFVAAKRTGASTHVAVLPSYQAARETQTANDEMRDRVYGGAAGGAMSFLGGAEDALTFGMGMRGLGALDPGITESYRKSVEEHPYLNVGGEIAGMAVPGIGEVAVAGKLAHAGSEALGTGIRAARFAEGAALGGAGTAAHATATGDPLTAESLLVGMGAGGVLNVGAGALGDRLRRAGTAAGAAVERRTAAETAETLFEKDSPGYDALREARDSQRAATAGANADVAAASKRYNAFAADPAKYERFTDGIQRAIGDLKDQYNEAFGADLQEGDLGVLGDESDVRSSAHPAAIAMRESIADMETRLGTLRDAFRTGTPGAMEAAAALRDEIVQSSVKPIAGRIPALPMPPGAPVPHLDVRFPTDLEGFARMTPEKVAEAGTYLNNWGAVSAGEVDAVNRLATELGVQPGASAGETLANVHQFLRDHAANLEALGDTDGGSHLGRLLRWAARKTARAAVGGAIGGVLGGKSGRLAGEMIGLMTGPASASAAAEARSAVRDTVQRLVARYAGKAGTAVTRLGPVTAYLSRSFPSGRRDDRGDLTENAAARAADLARASVVAPDTAYTAVRPLMDGSGDLAVALHQKAVGQIAAASAAAPKNPGTSPGNWRPGPTEAVGMAYRLEALQRPMDAIARVLSGEVHPEAVRALQEYWPALVQLTTDAAALHDNEMGRPGWSGVSALTGNPRFGLDNPASTLTMQGLYTRGIRAGSDNQAPSGAPLGRPPKAGRTDIAGSNVEQLTNQ